jgi:hypothetical protein
MNSFAIAFLFRLWKIRWLLWLRWKVNRDFSRRAAAYSPTQGKLITPESMMR